MSDEANPTPAAAEEISAAPDLDVKKPAELKSKESPRKIYKRIWAEFAEDRKKNRAQAYTRLQQNFSKYATELVPQYMTAKEHLGIIAEIETHTKSDQRGSEGDPQQIVGAWLRGDTDLSRIPLDKLQ